MPVLYLLVIIRAKIAAENTNCPYLTWLEGIISEE